MDNSSSLVESQIPQNLSRLYNEHTYVKRAEDETFDDEITRYTRNTYPDTYEFFIYILLFTPPQEFYRCVGSLLTHSWVLTAASCIVVRKILPQNIRCIQAEGEFGNYFQKRIDTSFDEEINLPHIQERSVSNVTVHPKHSIITGVYDLAVLKMNKKFTRNIYIYPLDHSLNLPFTNCWVIGIVLQNNENEEIDTVIKTINNVTISSTDLSCKVQIRQVLGERRLLCAEYSYKSGCMGEHGLPLICNGRLAGVGTTPSFIYRDGDKFQPNFITWNKCRSREEYYFNYIIDNIEWIRNNTPTDGYMSIHFNTNWVLIILPLVSIS